jgi:hypothetical protein
MRRQTVDDRLAEGSFNASGKSGLKRIDSIRFHCDDFENTSQRNITNFNIGKIWRYYVGSPNAVSPNNVSPNYVSPNDVYPNDVSPNNDSPNNVSPKCRLG